MSDTNNERVYTPAELSDMDAKAPPLAHRDIQERNDRNYQIHADAVMDFLQMPRRLSEVNEWSNTCKPKIPTKLAEEVVFWLELNGQVIREKGNGSATYRAKMPDRITAIARIAEKKGDDDMWITKDEAGKILGVAGSWFYLPMNTKGLNRKKEGNAYLYERGAVMALAKQRESASPVVRRPVAVAPPSVAAVPVKKQRKLPSDDYRAHVLWVTCGVTLGEFTPEEALKRIETLSSGQ